MAKNITPDDIKKFFNELVKETKTQQNDLCEIILNNNFQGYLRFFESEFENAIKKSIFEYNIKFIAYTRKDNLNSNILNEKIKFNLNLDFSICHK